MLFLAHTIFLNRSTLGAFTLLLFLFARTCDAIAAGRNGSLLLPRESFDERKGRYSMERRRTTKNKSRFRGDEGGGTSEDAHWRMLAKQSERGRKVSRESSPRTLKRSRGRRKTRSRLRASVARFSIAAVNTPARF